MGTRLMCIAWNGNGYCFSSGYLSSHALQKWVLGKIEPKEAAAASSDKSDNTLIIMMNGTASYDI